MSPLLLLAFFVLPAAVLAQDMECHVEGVCTAFWEGSSDELSYNDCLQTCRDDVDWCNWVTYARDTNQCLHYSVCGAIAANYCEFGNNCFVGNVECEPEPLICDVRGFCVGFVLAPVEPADSASACLLRCQEHEDCEAFTYFGESMDCFLTDHCAFLDDTCTDCTTGQRGCEPEEKGH